MVRSLHGSCYREEVVSSDKEQMGVHLRAPLMYLNIVPHGDMHAPGCIYTKSIAGSFYKGHQVGPWSLQHHILY